MKPPGMIGTTRVDDVMLSLGVDEPPSGAAPEDDFIATLSSPSAMSGYRQEATIVAFVPVLFAWGFVYLVLFLFGWVKRGFQTEAS